MPTSRHSVIGDALPHGSEMTPDEMRELAEELGDQACAAPYPDPEHYPTLPNPGETLTEVMGNFFLFLTFNA